MELADSLGCRFALAAPISLGLEIALVLQQLERIGQRRVSTGLSIRGLLASPGALRQTVGARHEARGHAVHGHRGCADLGEGRYFKDFRYIGQRDLIGASKNQ